jgi:hypothetical protein
MNSSLRVLAVDAVSGASRIDWLELWSPEPIWLRDPLNLTDRVNSGFSEKGPLHFTRHEVLCEAEIGHEWIGIQAMR